jgi:hypothetical protein
MSVAVPEIYRHDQFTAHRKFFKLVGGHFTIFGLDGTLLASSEQKAFKLKEDIRVNDGSPGGAELLRIKADRVVDFCASYKVTDSQTGEHVGSLRRKGWSSLFRDSWEILDAEGIVRGKVMEESAWKAFIRRTVDAASLFLPQSYQVEIDGQVVATMRQNFNIFIPKFDVDLTLDTEGILPRPLALATVVLFLAIEGRQD